MSLRLFQAILAGDFILSAASMALARIGNITVVKVLSQVIEDLVRGTAAVVLWWRGGWKRHSFGFHPSVSVVLSGEFMQLGSKENEKERFKHYLEKTFKKTASLIANSCKAVCTFLPHTSGPMGGGPALAPVRSPLLSSQVSILVNSDPEVHEIAFQYGKNVGIAFQVVRPPGGGVSYLHFRCRLNT